MSKELPYFQFEPAEYLTKDISFCSLQAQGLFINICAYYWQRECRLTKKQVLKRFNYPEVFEELIDEEIIKIDKEDNIVIKFLLSQYSEIIYKKSNDSEKGKIGNLKRWHSDIYERYKQKEITLNEALTIAKTSGGDNLAISKTSQIREDKIRENKKNIFNFKKSLLEIGFDEKLIDDWLKVRKLKKATNSKTAFSAIQNEVEKTNLDINEILRMHVIRSWSGFKIQWYLNELEKEKEKKVAQKKENQSAAEIIQRKYGIIS